MSKKSFYGVATNSKGKHKATIDGKNTKSYDTWHSMLTRCYCPKVQARYPTYLGCSVSDEWLEYQDFGDWFEDHEYSHHGYHLDKDLLIPNNKIYAPDRCVFVPQELNKLLTDRGNARGQYPQGVCFHKNTNKFMAGIKINGKREHLGRFDTVEEAHQVYKVAKEANVKRMVLEWKDRIASDVFDALMNWELGS